ncbi:MSMEG_4193 family putative phosphomutase [Nocardioides albus]|uniref:Putative phosphomutase (TIGR03848 family) n=2 Tax=Nocardioides albus TaxID=1841 RepID=A0A7W5A3G2_9ACTN|nr:MSMEG_4193 family putative phosphomutase [Nocardioides albus]MBB3088967.1 putative phosphomutase (TIGR03848 family) [Nocardioides albus]GGU15151.1 phosphoglycerate mutase [Nocardioides albus]
MATMILVRHGRTTANASGTLAGRLLGVKLDERGLEQASRAAERIAPVPLALAVTSPMERCQQTLAVILEGRAEQPAVVVEDGVSECDYGEWQGEKLSTLARRKLWKTVQAQPSAVTFPGGESMPAMQARGVEAVRRHDAAVTAAHGDSAVWLCVSHGDLIKAILADALGMHLDLFQRLHVDPASISVVRYGEGRPSVLATNTHAGDLSWLAPQPAAKKGRKSSRRRNDAVVGGGSGPEDGLDKV